MEQQRLNVFAYVKYNLQLELRQKSKEDKYFICCSFANIGHKNSNANTNKKEKR